jgi:hypothetical protein
MDHFGLAKDASIWYDWLWNIFFKQQISNEDDGGVPHFP